MTQYRGRIQSLPKVSVVLGLVAVSNYIDGERDEAILNIKHFEFDTLPELNAFILGIETATGRLDTLVLPSE